jgi:hypothetical protein
VCSDWKVGTSKAVFGGACTLRIATIRRGRNATIWLRTLPGEPAAAAS